MIIVIGFGLMLSGLIALFGMVVGIVAPGVFLSFGAYALTFVGMLLGIFGLAQRPRRR